MKRRAVASVIAIAVRVLPGSVRARYAEEWRAECATLSTFGEQIVFAISVLVSAPRTAMATRHDDSTEFLEVALAAIAGGLGPLAFAWVSASRSEPGLAVAHGVLGVGLVSLGVAVWRESGALFTSMSSRLLVGVTALAAVALGVSSSHVPAPGPYEPHVKLGVLVVAIGLVVIGSTRLFPARAMLTVRAGSLIAGLGAGLVAVSDLGNAFVQGEEGAPYVLALVLTAFGSIFGCLLALTVVRRPRVFVVR